MKTLNLTSIAYCLFGICMTFTLACVLGSMCI